MTDDPQDPLSGSDDETDQEPDRPNRKTGQRSRLSRRRFIAGGSTAALASLATSLLLRRRSDRVDQVGETPDSTDSAPDGSTSTSTTTSSASVPPPPGQRWSERFSDDEGAVVIDSDIVLDRDVRVASLTVAWQGRLTLDPNASITLTSGGNVIVLGELVMEPASADRVHTLRFDQVDEAAFNGGGMAILDDDVGLWVAETGILHATGAARNPWTRVDGALTTGQTTLVVDDASGWRVGDRLSITPTIAPTVDTGGFHLEGENALAYDDAIITSVAGSEIGLDRPLEHDHPFMSFTGWDGSDHRYGAEVLNLTRNVVIAGTEQGRAHVLFLHCQNPQNLANVQFDQLGPRSSRPSKDGKKIRTDGVTGRYPFHMHHCGDGVQGSMIESCLVTNSGNRAFVPHESHGVTLKRCVAHDVRGTAYWWDMPGRHNPTGEKPVTHDSLWTECVASKVWADQLSDDGYRLAGFNLSDGNHFSNTAERCVAVGVTGPKVTKNTASRSGFHWTEHGQAVWNFNDCLAHNIAGNGILTWQNDEEVHRIENFTAFHCAMHGVEHGAYSNFYHYDGLNLVANRLSGIGLHAVTRRTNSVRREWTDQGQEAPTLTFENVMIDGRSITVDGVRGLSHRFAAEQPEGPTLLRNFRIESCTRSGLFEGEGKNAAYYIVSDWQVDDVQPIMIDSGAPAETRIDVAGLNGSPDAYTVSA